MHSESGTGLRTHTCGDLRSNHVGQSVVLKGWVDTRRDLGGLIFVDLRDRYGLTQIVFEPQQQKDVHGIAEGLKSEYVISVVGKVVARSIDQVNKKLKTGSIEVLVHQLDILNDSEPIPFTVSAHEKKRQKANEDLRLQYRYLDMRRPELQRNLILRHKLYQSVRRYYDSKNFIEIETPVLMKSTPEGARDYLVPSRVHSGKFYALPQSPQTYKQILMIAGMDRYFQIVKCFRDEDLRADRQPEFTQIDVEMTFATEDLVHDSTEGLMAAIWSDLKGVNLQTPFPRMSHDEAIRRFGSDKPDLRFGMEIQDLSDVFQESGFNLFDGVLSDGGSIVGVTVSGEGDRGRGAMDRLDKNVVRKRIGAGGLIYFQRPSDGSELKSSVKSDILPSIFVENALESTGAEVGDLVLVLAGATPRVFEQMGSLRLHMANELELISRSADGPWEFLWVTDFPMFEPDENEGGFTAVHHPFTAPKVSDLELMYSDPGAAHARAYDLVLNGTELGGGSIRIHQQEVQRQMFKILGISDDEADRRFGFLLEAFRYGAPPHGGIALGLDRIAMLLSGSASLREVIAFPKTQSAQELMVSSPDVVDDSQLEELHIRVVEHEDDK
ncbi:MAG: aspartate--tRNA ligase [Rhodothermia bacterium]|nr:MAG: aspartate--tRNA ligase [Rhodothermia bacterium]